MKPGVTLTATIYAKPGKEAEVLEILHSFVAPTRAEKGCINYDLHVLKDAPGTFMFYENWATKEDLDAHSKMPHLKPLGLRADELLAKPTELTFFSMLTDMNG